ERSDRGERALALLLTADDIGYAAARRGGIHVDVRAHGEVGGDALLGTPAGDEADPLRHRMGRIGGVEALAVEPDGSRPQRKVAEQRPADGVMARTAQADQAERLAR